MTRHDVEIRMFLDGQWRDVTSTVFSREPIEITRGRPDEASDTPPQTCNFALDNRTGDYSPRNPVGQWYGSIGRNTPCQVLYALATDTFTRSVTGGWTTADTGQAWTVTGSGGTVANSDFAVTGSVGTQSVPVTGASRYAVMAATSYRDVDIRVDVSLAFTDVTGGDVEPANVIARWQSHTNYYFTRLVITSAEAVTITLRHSTGGQLASPVTVAGLTHTSSQTLRVRMQVEGETLRAKVWAASGDEPLDWQVQVHDSTITTAGGVGVRSGVAAANTNAKPIVFSYDNFTVSTPRFTGEIALLREGSDASVRDRYVNVEVAGVTRRLSQGAAPVMSAMRRGLLSVEPVAYWPAEDGGSATGLSSVIPGVSPMIISGDLPDFATNVDFASSAPLPVMNATTSYTGQIPDYFTGEMQVRFFLSIPSGGTTDDANILQLYNASGTLPKWNLTYGTGGTFRLVALDTDEVAQLDTGDVAFTLDGRPLRVSLEIIENGGDIDWALSVLDLDAQGGGTSGTIVGETFGPPATITFGGGGGLDGVTIGQVSVQSEVTNIFELVDQLIAYDGERALTRLIRLCAENGVTLDYVGNAADTPRMGPQRVNTLLTLVRECAAADMGSLYEPKGTVGLTYRTLTSTYNQDAAVTFNLGNHQLAAPFQPVEDDQRTRNDVTAQRVNGGEARVVLESGRMSVQPAPDGVGRYDVTYEVNAYEDGQLPDVASWQVTLGTVDEPRYPDIHVDLDAPDATSLLQSVLNTDIDQRITITNADEIDVFDDVEQLVRGYSETLDNYRYKLDVTASPYSPYALGVLDSSTARLDSDASTLAEDLDASETAVDVATTGATAPLWTTSAGDMPFDIIVGGERMTVTAVSGATSPQTFTVTRAVNGVTKTHATGTSVHVFTPLRLGL